MKKLSSLSVFFPVYNDKFSILRLVEKTKHILPRVADTYEVIIVDDGSNNDTQYVLKQMHKFFPKLKIIHHPKNFGYGAALASGFKSASKDWVFYTDGDGQYDLQDLIKLVKNVKPGIDVINGYKIKRADNLIRKISGGFYNYLLHKFYKLPIQDVDCDFRLIRRSKLKNIKLTKKSGIICLELILKLQKNGAKFNEAEVNHYPRLFGKSQFFHLRKLKENLIELLTLKV